MLNGSRPKSATVSVKSSQHDQKPKNTVNPQKREKLKTLLIDKYCKKYGESCTEDLIKEEVNLFLDKETLTAKELKELDKKIEYLIHNKDSVYKLKQNLITTNQSQIPMKLDDIAQNFNINDHNNPNADKLSVMSYSTKNSKFRGYPDDNLTFHSKEKPVERIEFNDKGEWEAIAEFNKLSFKENQLHNKVKEKEKKLKTKIELIDQMNQKQGNKNNEKIKELEYGIVVSQHVDHLTNIEKLKLLKEKEKMLHEKKIRDGQLFESKKKKKIEFKSQRDYDLSFLKRLKNEAEEEQRKLIQKKNEKHEELVATLKENEAHKKVLYERMLREREEDIKSQIEYTKILDKQEKDRAEYFKSKERKGNTFTNLMVENVIKDLENKNKKLEETIEKYHKEKDKRYKFINI